MVRHINYTILVFGTKPRRVGSTYTLYKMSRRSGGTILHRQIYCALRMDAAAPPKRRLILYILYIVPTQRGFAPKTKIIRLLRASCFCEFQSRQIINL